MVSTALGDALIIIGASLALVAVVAWLALYLTLHSFPAKVKHWSNLARRLGLTYTVGDTLRGQPKVTGTYRGYPVLLDAVIHKTGKASSYWTRMVLRLDNRAKLDLMLYAANPLERVEQVSGVKYVLTGDDTFDRRFILQGHPEGLAAQMVNSVQLRSELFTHRQVRLRVRNELISYEMRGIEVDQVRLEAVIDMLVELSIMIESAMVKISLN